jgi:hypothetical protein
MDSTYFFFASRIDGGQARVKRTISSHIIVLISRWKLKTLVPVISYTIASLIDLATSMGGKGQAVRGAGRIWSTAITWLQQGALD